jgi:uncharacterized protein (TIGR02231 family)
MGILPDRSVLHPALILPLLALAAPGPAQSAEFSPATRVTAVTVYRDGALVTREAELNLPAGDHRILLKEIPAVADPASIRVSGTGAEGISIGGVEVSQDFRQPGLTTEYKALEKELQDFVSQISALDDRQKSIESLREFLGGLKATAGQESSKDLLTRGFAVESWQKAFEFLSARLNGLAEEQRGMALKRKDLSEKADVVRQKLSQLASQGGNQRWSATVLVSASRGGAMTLRATYLAHSASWTPMYDARLDASSGKVEMVWQSQVTQNTGEDWKEVAMTLSTTRPSVGIDLPKLTPLQARPMPIASGGFVAGLPVLGKDYQDVLTMSPGVTDGVNQPGSKVSATRKNEAAVAEAAAPPAPLETPEAKAGRRDVAVTFGLPGKLDIPSDSQPHKHRISAREMEGRLEYHSVPRLVPAVYLVAKVTLAGEIPLLPGRVQHFVGPDMVGSSWMSDRAGGEEFPLSFGPDDRLKAERKLIASKVDHKGKDDETDSRFVTTLENRLGRDATVELKDQIPVSGDERISVSLDREETTPGFTTDPDEPGIMTWKIAVPKGGKKEVVLRYRVRAPRAMPLAGIQ